jgi:hypothetical protein
MTRMTPSLSIPSRSHASPGVLDGPPVDRLGPDLQSDSQQSLRESTLDHLSSIVVDIIAMWYLATCHRCGPGLGQPFRDLVERDEWAIKHAESTGHVVYLGVEGDDTAHGSASLRYFAYGAIWRWACLAPSCAARASGPIRWNGPYDSGQLALAAWRAHGTTR